MTLSVLVLSGSEMLKDRSLDFRILVAVRFQSRAQDEPGIRYEVSSLDGNICDYSAAQGYTDLFGVTVIVQNFLT